MTAHVAEAHEDRGRVVLYTPASGRLSTVAVDAALRVARGFHSEVESLFVADPNIFELERFSFVSAVAFDGATAVSLDAEHLRRGFEMEARATHRRVTSAAGLSGIRTRARTVVDEPVRAIATTCAENGPWNVVALGEAIGGHSAQHLSALFETVEAATGFIAVGRKVRRASGPIVAIVEDGERVAGVVRAAQRLAEAEGEALHLWLVDETRVAADALEAEVRLALGLKAQALQIRSFDLETSPIPEISAELSALKAGFVMCRFGGLLVPQDFSSGHIGQDHEGPLLLVR